MTTTPKPDPYLERLFQQCVKTVEKRWGSYALSALGPAIYSALLSEEVLVLCAAQDEELVFAGSVRKILNYCRSRIIDVTQGQQS